MELILSTRNRSKIDQIKAMFAGLNVSIVSLAEAGIGGNAVEDGTTLEENALKKAVFASTQAGKWALADDTGLFIDALGGKPGIYSARWAGENATTEDTMRFTLERLKDIAPEKRTATFTTVAVIASPKGEQKIFTGSVRGKILAKPRVACQPNMPYSAIFVPDGQEKVWAEMSVGEENAISHRGKAFREVRGFLANILL